MQYIYPKRGLISECILNSYKSQTGKQSNGKKISKKLETGTSQKRMDNKDMKRSSISLVSRDQQLVSLTH